jgi:putative DNA primase/helicase
VQPHNIPDSLRSSRRWLNWRWEASGGKVPKRAANPQQSASSTDPSTWAAFDDALATYQRPDHDLDGIGIALDGSGLVGIDLDNCRDLASGDIAEPAWEIVRELDTYAEVSPSGTGIRLFAEGSLDGLTGRKGGYGGIEVEIYDSGRYLTVTGHHIPCTPPSVNARQGEIESVHGRVLGSAEPPEPLQPSSPPNPLLPHDAALLELARNAKNGAKFRRLFDDGDISGHTHPNTVTPDHSRADSALARMLNFWTGNDYARTSGLFEQSALMREKWNSPRGSSTYGANTVARAWSEETYEPPSNPGTQEPLGSIGGIDGELSDREWPARKPLPSGRQPAPSLPPDMIPPALRDWIADAADRIELAAEMIAAALLIALATLLGARFGIKPKQHDDWLVVANLWGAIIAPPGSMKTAAVQEGLRHLARLEAEAKEAYEADLAEASVRVESLEAQISSRKKELAKPSLTRDERTEVEQDLIALREKLDASRPVRKRYYTQDATPERLLELEAETGNGIGVFRDELSGLFASFEKLGREGERQMYLEGWNGTDSYSSDRKVARSTHVDRHCLSVFGTLQPGVAETYVIGALEHGRGDDGLLQRLQMLVWPETSAEWKGVDRHPDQAARDRAWRVFQRLDRISPAEFNLSDDEGIPSLRFDADAQALFTEWRGILERRLRSGEFRDAPSFEAHLAKFRSLMPKLALIFHLVHVADGGAPTAVTVDSARLAARWCEYLEAHARKVYAPEVNHATISAHALAERIVAGDVPDGITVRELKKKNWSGLTVANDVQAALDILEANGWSFVEKLQNPKGGQPSLIVHLHPELGGAP